MLPLPEGKSFHAFVSYSHSRDSLLSMRLQRALQGFGNTIPWSRAMRVFRDETNLAATADLATEIENGLRQSAHFVLLASPDSSHSPWVAKEVRSFLTTHPIDHLSIAVTAGVTPWDPAGSAGEPAISEELVDLLKRSSDGYVEPLMVDLRPYRDASWWTLTFDEAYLSRVATLAAAILKRDKDSLFGRHISGQRRGMAALLAIVLTIAIALALALQQSRRARTSEVEALRQAGAARSESERAKQSAALAAAASEQADRARDLARAGQETAEQQRARAERGESAAKRSAELATERQRAADVQRAQALLRGGNREAGLVVAVKNLSQQQDGASRVLRSLLLEALSAKIQSWALSHGTAHVNSSVFSPTGNRIVTAGMDGVAVLWDTRTGAKLATMDSRLVEGGGRAIDEAIFSKDGRWIATANWTGVIHIWDGLTGKFLRALQGHADRAYSIALSPDGRRLVSASFDGTARTWNVESGKSIATMRGHVQIVRQATFSPDGREIVSASDDRSAAVWDANTGLRRVVLTGHVAPLNSAEYSPDGSKIATSSSDGTTRVWSAPSGDSLLVVQRGSKSAAFSPDGGKLLIVTEDGTALIVDALTGKNVAQIGGDPRHRVDSASYSPNGRNVLTGSMGGYPAIWDSNTGQLLATLESPGGIPGWRATFSADGQYVVSSEESYRARVWELRPWSVPIVLDGSGTEARIADFSKDGSLLLTAMKDGAASIWQTAPWRRTADFFIGSSGWAQLLPTARRVVTTVWGELAEQRAVVVREAPSGREIARIEGGHEARFSPDGRWVAAETADHVLILDASTGKVQVDISDLGPTPGAGDSSRLADFSPDSKAILVFGDKPRLIDPVTGREVAKLAKTKYDMVDASFSGDGRRVATATYDGAQLWDAHTGRLIARLEHWRHGVNRVAFSADGTRLLAGYHNQELWDGVNGQFIKRLDGGTGWFSPDGRFIVTRAASPIIWNARSGERLPLVLPETRQVNFLPKGETVMLFSGTTLRLWDLSLGQEIGRLDKACPITDLSVRDGLLSLAFGCATGGLSIRSAPFDAERLTVSACEHVLGLPPAVEGVTAGELAEARATCSRRYPESADLKQRQADPPDPPRIEPSRRQRVFGVRR